MQSCQPHKWEIAKKNITIPLALFGGPVSAGEKRSIDFNFHFKKEIDIWEYNLNLLNRRHRYTAIGTLAF